MYLTKYRLPPPLYPDFILTMNKATFRTLLALLLVPPAALYAVLYAAVTSMAAIGVDADYPGGNIILERIDGDVIDLRQNLRDTDGWWFYWNFRIRGAAGRTLTFRFTNRDVIGTRGPAVSLDSGQTWSWLGRNTVKGASFSYSFAPDAGSVRFAFAPAYQEADLMSFLAKYKRNKHVSVRELCKTRKGRSVEQIHIGKLDGQPAYRVLLTCRHHACESTASYVLDGILAALLADTADGSWFRENVEVLAVLFVDKDGVEEGDQGKNRKPRDHCRDYQGQSLYPSVAALCTLIPEWSAGRLRMAIDLHCPSIREKAVYMVVSQHEAIWNEQRGFARLLEAACLHSLPYKASDNTPFGKGGNKADNYKAGKSFFQWADELKGIRLSSAIEIPYANAGETTVTSETARAFGADIVWAMCQYLVSERGLK